MFLIVFLFLSLIKDVHDQITCKMKTTASSAYSSSSFVSSSVMVEADLISAQSNLFNILLIAYASKNCCLTFFYAIYRISTLLKCYATCQIKREDINIPADSKSFNCDSKVCILESIKQVLLHKPKNRQENLAGLIQKEV